MEDNCSVCSELPQEIFISLPIGKYSEYTDEDRVNEKRLEKIMAVLDKIKLIFTIYYGNHPTEVYQCPGCGRYYKHINEYSEDGPQNCSSEIWNRFEFIDLKEKEELEKWKKIK